MSARRAVESGLLAIVVGVEFSYSLSGSGWAEARIRSGDQFAHLRASYLEDPLGDLLGALLELRWGEQEARCSWEEEPGQWRWVFTVAGDFVRVRVLGFAETYSQEPDAAGSPVFSAEESLDSIVRAVASAARRLLDDLGEAEYRRRWIDHPFPTDYLVALEETVG